MIKWWPFPQQRGPSETGGDNSPIINADNNSGNINITLTATAGAHPLRDAPQSYGAYVDSLTRAYYPNNPLVANFRRFIEEQDRGYFAVEAEPGMGKSAFAAWVEARPETDAAHFVQNGAGAGLTAAVVRSLSAQLITAWKLDDLAPGGWLSDSSGEVEWLADVIEQAARRRNEQGSTRPIVLVVDALDAAYEYPAIELPFGLPQWLPERVYVVVTARTGQFRNLPWDQTRRVALLPESADNCEALEGFLRDRARNDPRIARALEGHGVAEEAFALRILERSRGSWVYAHYVIESIGQDPRRMRDLPGLPEGLEAYYQSRVLSICLGGDRQYDERRVRLLAALGVAGEPVDAHTLCSLAGLDEPSLVDALMRDGLQPFCTVVGPGEEADETVRYAPHHPSLREYLSGASDGTLRQAARAAHARICERYLAAWGGLESGLGTLAAQPQLAGADGGYPVRHLASHLLATDREADLHRLLALSRGRENLWYTVHTQAGDVGSYLRDVELAEAATGRLALRLRYRLIQASVTSAVTATPPRLVREMVIRGHWAVEQGFQRVAIMSNRDHQAVGVRLLVPDLPERMHPDVLRLAASYGSQERSAVLEAVLPLLADELVPVVVELALDTENGRLLPGPLATAAARLPHDALKDLVQHPLLKDRYGNRKFVRAVVALFLNPDRGAGARKAIRVLGAGKHEPDRNQLIALLQHSPVTEAVVDDVLTLLENRPGVRGDRPSTHGPRPTGGIERLRSVLEKGVDMDVAAHMLHVAAHLDWGRSEVPTLLELALRFRLDYNAPGLLYALGGELSTTEVRRWLNELFPSDGEPGRRLHREVRHVLLGAILDRLPPEEARGYAEREMSATPKIAWPPVQIERPLVWDTRPHLVRYLSPETRRRYVAEAVEAWEDDPRYAQTLATIAPHLSEEELGVALRAVNTEDAVESGTRVTALNVLAPYLSEHVLRQAVDSTSSPVRLDDLSAVAEIGRRLPPEARSRIGRRALTFVRGIPEPQTRADAVARLAPVLLSGAAVDALALLESESRSVPMWTEERVWRPLTATSADRVGSMELIEKRVYGLGGVARAVEALSGALPDEALPRAWAAAVGDDEESAAQVALWAPGLVSRLLSTGQDELLGGVLTYAAEHMPLVDEDEVPPLLRFAELVPVEQVRRACDVLLARRNGPLRARALAGLSRHLPDAERNSLAGAVLTILASARRKGRITNWPHSADAPTLGYLYQAGATEAATTALRTLLAASGEWDAVVLEAFGAPLPASVVEEALAMTLADEPGRRNYQVLVVLAPSLDGDQLQRALRAMVEDELDDGFRLRAVTAFASRLALNAADVLSPEMFAHALRMTEAELASEQGIIPLLARLRRNDAVRFRTLTERLINCHTPDASTFWAPKAGFASAVGVLERDELGELYERVTRARGPASRASAQATILRRLGDEWPGTTAPGGGDLPRTWPTGVDRWTLCGLLAASAWWIRRQGGNDAVDELVGALLDVVTWWPVNGQIRAPSRRRLTMSITD
ncbi:hypothetical protein [Micromonospora sp. LOL_024]|uniref:hypothetical protein n=1 Tax=Micromonospora sp. LOL_024 TaxID=3345412 RepID=UPI003A8B3B13